MNNIPSPKTINKAKRIGRGFGTGVGGHTVGRGTKGQKSRSGYTRPRPGFEGGRMPLSRRIPKLKGFSRAYANAGVEKVLLSLSNLEQFFTDGDVVSVEALQEKGYQLSNSKPIEIKIVANGEITKKLTVEGIKTSEGAKSKIEKAGGKVNNI